MCVNPGREQDRETHVSVNVTAPARRRAHVNAHRARAVARVFVCRWSRHRAASLQPMEAPTPWQVAGLDSYQPTEAPTPWHRTCALSSGRFRDPTSLWRPRRHGIGHVRWQAAGLDSYPPRGHEPVKSSRISASFLRVLPDTASYHNVMCLSQQTYQNVAEHIQTIQTLRNTYTSTFKNIYKLYKHNISNEGLTS